MTETLNRKYKLLQIIRKRTGFLLLLLLPIFLLHCSTARESTRSDAKDGWTMGEGIGTIADNEIGKAKDDAINDAKRDAVKKVVGTMIKSRTDIDSGVFQSSELTAKSEGFVDTYEIIDSGAISKYEYRVRIRAKVSVAKIEEAIEEIISQQLRPVMLVIMKEDLFGKPNDASYAGTALETEFTGKGFPLVDKATFQKVRRQQLGKMNEAITGNNQAAKELANLSGAEIVLVGTSTITSAGTIMDSNMTSIQCDVSVRVIEATTGNLIATGQEHSAYAHINPKTGGVEAAKKAVSMISKKLISTIMKKWKTGKVNVIDVAISGASYEQVKKIRSEFLEKIRGVKAVYRKENVNNVSILQVEFEGDSFALADRVLDARMTIPLTTGAVKRNYIEFKVK